MKNTFNFLFLLSLLFVVACNSNQKQNETNTMKDYKPGINKITFQSEGVELVGNLYLPDSYKPGDRLPAIVVGGSWTTVKEQMAGLYAETLAKNGFATLAFDHRYYGESGGEPRFFENPAAKSEDFINAMNFINNLPMVDASKTAGLAVCASGGYMADAISKDDRFKAFAAIVPWFNTDEVVNAFYGGEEGINDRLGKARAAQASYQETGEMTYIPSISDTDPNAAMFGPFDYYLDEDLGKVPNWSHDKFALINWEKWLTYRPVSSAENIAIPTLIITSEGAATPQADQEFYDKLQGPKELIWMEGAQLEFYHKPALVKESLAHVAEYFRTHLN